MRLLAAAQRRASTYVGGVKINGWTHGSGLLMGRRDGMTQGEQNRGLILPGLQRWVTTDLIDWRTSSVECPSCVWRSEARWTVHPTANRCAGRHPCWMRTMGD